METQSTQESDRNELVLAFVAPVGVNMDRLRSLVSEYLEDANYEARFYALSEQIRSFAEHEATSLTEYPEKDRILSFIKLGNEMRKNYGNDILVRMAIGQILSTRAIVDPPKDISHYRWLPNTAHVIISIKHPEEIMLLRKVYASSLYVIGIYSPRDTRRDYLCTSKEMTDLEAEEIIERDEKEQHNFGQDTRGALELADAFILSDDTGPIRSNLRRFLDLVLGNPHETPTVDEHGMFQAYGASLCSGSLSRQYRAEGVHVRLVLTPQFDVVQRSSVTYNVVGDIQNVVRLVVGTVHLEDLHRIVDQLRQPDLPHESVHEADTAERRRTDALAHRELLVSPSKDWTVLVRPRVPTETFVHALIPQGRMATGSQARMDPCGSLASHPRPRPPRGFPDPAGWTSPPRIALRDPL